MDGIIGNDSPTTGGVFPDLCKFVCPPEYARAPGAIGPIDPNPIALVVVMVKTHQWQWIPMNLSREQFQQFTLPPLTSSMRSQREN